jgi:hypothetical protein
MSGALIGKLRRKCLILNASRVWREGIVPGGNRESSRGWSKATPPDRGPKNSPPRRGVAEDLFPGWSLARPAGVHSRGGCLPAVSLRSTVGYFLGCLRHRIDAPRRRGHRAFFANFPLTESGLPVSSAEGAGQERRTQIGTPFQGSPLNLRAFPGRCPDEYTHLGGDNSACTHHIIML